MGESVGILVNGVTGIQQDALSGIFTATEAAIQSINWAELGNTVADGLSRAWGIVSGIGDVALGLGESVVGAGQQGVTALKGWIASWNTGDAESAAEAAGKQIVTDFNAGVTGTKADLVKTADEAAQAFLDAIKTKLSFQAFQGIGLDAMGGIVHGFTMLAAEAATMSGNAAQGLCDAVTVILSVDAGTSTGGDWAEAIGAGVSAKQGQLVSGAQVFARAGTKAAESVLNTGAGRTTGAEYASSIAQGIQSGRGSASNAASTLARAVAAVINGMSGTFESVGRNIVEGVARGIERGSSRIRAAAKSAAQTAYRTACDTLDIRSPSRVMAQVGQFYSEGFAGGITDGMERVSRAVQQLSAAAIGESAQGVPAQPVSVTGPVIDYDALAEATVMAMQRAGVGEAALYVNGRKMSDELEPDMSRATYNRAGRSAKGRTSRMVLA